MYAIIVLNNRELIVSRHRLLELQNDNPELTIVETFANKWLAEFGLRKCCLGHQERVRDHDWSAWLAEDELDAESK